MAGRDNCGHDRRTPTVERLWKLPSGCVRHLKIVPARGTGVAEGSHAPSGGELRVMRHLSCSIMTGCGLALSLGRPTPLLLLGHPAFNSTSFIPHLAPSFTDEILDDNR